MSTIQVRFKVPKIYNSRILNQSFIKFSLDNIVLTICSGIFQNPVVLVWYYHLPFYSNIETQVETYHEFDKFWVFAFYFS